MIPDLIERKSGKYSGMPLADIVEQHFQETGERVELSNAGSIYFGDASVESEAQFCERVGKWLQTELPKYADKRVLVVAHGGVFRAVTHYFEHIPYEIAFNRKYFPTLPNAAYVEFPHTPRVNPMDRWIIGELQTLNAKVQNAYEKYDLQTMARSILDFMDDLTNWYVRRSRRRFWKSETDMDKASAYETLYRVLQEVCQIAAPVIPFVTEHIYRGLTEKESVHLEFFPEWNRFSVPQDITSDMALTKQLVSLGLALRGRKKLRVRQPLASVTIGVVLPEYFIDILKEELNVKEVFQGADMSQVAKLVCRPNARLIGPRFGKQVQEIIVSAKSGAFTLLDDGSVRVGDAVLAVGEFELVYEPISSEFDVEGGGGQVILMDTCITQALRDEGIARDAVRTIQDLRKEADYAVSDRVELFISGGQEIREALEKNREYILGETLADNLFFEETDTSDIQTGVMFEETEVKFALKRVAR